ncbi:putative DNA primase large subunit, eukaryotic/archaeal [Rosa chinensis]|uniref:Putative DNA primase large subunit, eukaryotic/archaeal n=1 Tax=Rosa chinensis TaxID=74649 RepID=A0A2P6QX19_ROSCH|nr:putative DNA primase large subunit, eukaryotic/archaeal [Rosa chinensis]
MDAALFRHRFRNEKPEAQVTHGRIWFCLPTRKLIFQNSRNWTSTIVEQEKNRLTPIVETLSTSYLGPDYSQAVHYLPKEFAEIPLRDIDDIAKNSFPMCMRQVVEKLREEHHPKHGGRMQLGLFQEMMMCETGVGLKLNDALAFGKLSSHERFDKEYAYSIRHKSTIMEEKKKERITCLIPVKRSSHLLLVLKIIMDAHINISGNFYDKIYHFSGCCLKRLKQMIF